MIVVAIVGILAAVAYPSYQEYVKKGNRAAAQAFMMEVAQRQQNYLLNSRAYAEDLGTLGLSVPDDVSPFYEINVSKLGVDAGPPPSFSLRMDPIGDTLQASDGSLCITNGGSRTRNCQAGGTAESW